MNLRGHLRELKNRAFASAVFIMVGSIAGWYVFDQVFAAMQEPILEVAKNRGIEASVNFGTVGGAFDLRIQMSVFIGIVLTSPIWLFNTWAFIRPALKKNERRYSLGFLLTALPLFLGGCYIAWIAIPGFVDVLIGMTPQGSANIINANDYILFMIRILLVFGLAFVSPVFIVLLNFMGVLTAKAIIKGWRVATVISAVIAALATPTADPTSMFLLMVPLMLLYFVAAAIASLRDRFTAKRAVASV